MATRNLLHAPYSQTYKHIGAVSATSASGGFQTETLPTWRAGASCKRLRPAERCRGAGTCYLRRVFPLWGHAGPHPRVGGDRRFWHHLPKQFATSLARALGHEDLAVVWFTAEHVPRLIATCRASEMELIDPVKWNWQIRCSARHQAILEVEAWGRAHVPLERTAAFPDSTVMLPVEIMALIVT